MPRLDLRSFDNDAAYQRRTLARIEGGMVCGFCIFNGSTERTTEILSSLQSTSISATGRYLLFSIDAEWGLSMRLSGVATEFPHALALAHSRWPNAIVDAAIATAIELRAVGIHWSFAPVADVNSDLDNPIINIRSFGEEPSRVCGAAAEYARGLAIGNIIACAKHFPGHGQTRVDSHRALPILDMSLEHFEQIEFPPFCRLIAEGVPSIMTGHLAAPLLARSLGADEEMSMRPASVSRVLISELLRGRLAYDGVVITDSMEMGALNALFTSTAEAATEAIRAGNDIVLMSPDTEQVHETLCTLYSKDEAFASLVDASVKRIERLYTQIDFSPNTYEPDFDAHTCLAESIAFSAIEGYGDIKGLADLRFICIIADDPKLQRGHVELLEAEVSAKLPNLQLITLREVTEELANELVVVILERPRGKLLDQSNDVRSETPVAHFIRFSQKLQLDPNCIIFLGNPYLKRSFEPLEGKYRVCTYSDSAPSIKSVVQWLHSKQ